MKKRKRMNLKVSQINYVVPKKCLPSSDAARIHAMKASLAARGRKIDEQLAGNGNR